MKLNEVAVMLCYGDYVGNKTVREISKISTIGKCCSCIKFTTICNDALQI